MTDNRTGQFEIQSVNVGRPQLLLRWPSGDVTSSIDKRPVDASRLELSELNLEGDEQSDTRATPGGGQVHGGIDQAVYAFPEEHYPTLAEIVGSELWAGYMGENLTIRGGVEADACVGDVWAWGDARLQISGPRGPCYKLGIRMGKQSLRTAVRERGIVGWYLRVLQPGLVPTSGTIRVVSRHPSGVTVAHVHSALQDRRHTYPELAKLDTLTPHLRHALMVRDRDLAGGVAEADG